MCNFLFTSHEHVKRVEREFGVELPADPQRQAGKRPTDKVTVITATGAELMRWGLVPHWANEIPQVLMTHARVESLDERPAYRGLLAENRCLVPTTGYHERPGALKREVSRADGDCLLLAGLWDEWRGLKSVTIVTTEPNAALAVIVDRMPLVLEPADAEVWLRGTEQEARKLLFPHDPALTVKDPSGQADLFA